jgi:hypothetical protein
MMITGKWIEICNNSSVLNFRRNSIINNVKENSDERNKNSMTGILNLENFTKLKIPKIHINNEYNDYDCIIHDQKQEDFQILKSYEKIDEIENYDDFNSVTSSDFERFINLEIARKIYFVIKKVNFFKEYIRRN